MPYGNNQKAQSAICKANEFTFNHTSMLHMSVWRQEYTTGHLEMKSSVRISRMEVWTPGISFQTNANMFSYKYLFLSYAILLRCDSYICIQNKNNVLLRTCS